MELSLFKCLNMQLLRTLMNMLLRFSFHTFYLLQFQNATRVDLVLDRYMKSALKSTARAKRGKGIHRHVASGTPIPGNWQNFLCVNSNTTDLFQFVSHALTGSFNLKEKQLMITIRESVLSKPLPDDLDSISSCTHEEANTSMLLHIHCTT